MKLFRLRYGKPGTSPGEFAAAAAKPAHPPVLSLIDYSETEVTELADATLEQAREYFATSNKTWLHVQGSPGLEMLHAIGEAYHLHPLAVEDVLNVGQRAKLEPFDDQYFIVLHCPIMHEDEVVLEQVSLFLGPNYVVSFHDGMHDIFEPIRQRLRSGGRGRIRRYGADYLCYALVDLIVDLGFPLLDQVSEKLEGLEQEVIGQPRKDMLDRIYLAKRELVALRRGLAPQRELLTGLLRDDHPLITEHTVVYLRDAYDHMVRILETVESYRELCSGIQDLYMSNLGNRMNEIMKVLTLMASIFIPLSFFAGLYGMNFNTEISAWNMPELSSPYGYPLLLLFMLIVAGTMLAWFRWKDWF